MRGAAPQLRASLRSCPLAVEWGVITRVPCSIRLLKAPKSEATFHDFDEFERLVQMARSEALALLVVLLGGEAGLRCGEMMALEWTDIDFAKRQLTVARSEWKGHVTLPKGGRLRYVPMTRQLTDALEAAGVEPASESTPSWASTCVAALECSQSPSKSDGNRRSLVPNCLTATRRNSARRPACQYDVQPLPAGKVRVNVAA